MSQPDDPETGDLEERLMDQAFREILGGETPPDLLEKVLSAADERPLVSTQHKKPSVERPKRRYHLTHVQWAAVVCIAAGGCISLMLPAVQKRWLELPMAELASREASSSPAGSTTPPTPSADQTKGMSERMSSKMMPSGGMSGGSMSSGGMSGGMTSGGSMMGGSMSSGGVSSGGVSSGGTMGGMPGGMSSGMGSSGGMARGGTAGGSMMGPSFPFSAPDGYGPGLRGDQYERVGENPFRRAMEHPLSTFSIDVDTASYANVRRFLLQEGQLPPPDAVRIEELINYFDYEYEGPSADVPFAADIEVAACPWTVSHRLVRLGLKGRVIHNQERPPSNLVFLLDVSGSMSTPDKLPLLKEGLKLLVEQLRSNDRVAIVVYASAEGLVLPSTVGSDHRTIVTSIDHLEAGGSTAGGAGLDLAYRIADESFIQGGINRVILCTDGDFNVGTTSTAALERMVEERAKSGVFLSVLGFGRGNLNDAMMERISNKGNGNYAYIDGLTEARKVLVQQAGGTLVTIAKDVKIQVEFNPAQVAAYRLIGYENRMLAAEDFRDDKKDAGEIGAGHTVTALYEIVPVGVDVNVPGTDPLKYQTSAQPAGDRSIREELLTLKIRYKDLNSATSDQLAFPVVDRGAAFGNASADFQFAAAVASFGMLLRGSQYAGAATYESIIEIAGAARGSDAHGYRAELLEMARRARILGDR